MIANRYLLNLTLELLYRSDIMTDTENDCKQKNKGSHQKKMQNDNRVKRENNEFMGSLVHWCLIS